MATETLSTDDFLRDTTWLTSPIKSEFSHIQFTRLDIPNASYPDSFLFWAWGYIQNVFRRKIIWLCIHVENCHCLFQLMKFPYLALYYNVLSIAISIFITIIITPVVKISPLLSTPLTISNNCFPEGRGSSSMLGVVVHEHGLGAGNGRTTDLPHRVQCHLAGRAGGKSGCALTQRWCLWNCKDWSHLELGNCFWHSLVQILLTSKFLVIIE